MQVVVIGSGYVGLVSGVCLAAKGHNVTCVDVNPIVVDQLNSGKPHIFENGLEVLLQTALRQSLFRATTDLSAAMSKADGVLIAVGTPSENGVIDLRYIRQAAQSIGTALRQIPRFMPIVVKSTTIPGTTDTVVREELEAASGRKLAIGDMADAQSFGLGMNPEFLREGNAVDDFMIPDRIVMGHEDEGTRQFLDKLYSPWDCDKLFVNTRTAELIKYSNNALLALQISAVNEIANLAAKLGGIDILDVMRGIHMDKRWNPIKGNQRTNPEILTYLIPGCGFGGSCFPKDVQALRSQGEHLGQPMKILNAILDVNAEQPHQVIKILQDGVGVLSNKKCLVLGLAFKPDTDDVRDTASLPIIRDLLGAGAKVVAHDPIAMGNFQKMIGEQGNLSYCQDWQSEVQSAEIILIATKWAEYKKLPELGVSGRTVFDARRLLKPESLGNCRYLSIGRNL